MILRYIVKQSNYINVRQVLRTEFDMSKRLITKLKLNKRILLNGIPTYPDKIINENDIITCNIDFDEISENIVPTKMKLDIIYEDDCFLIVNKPPNTAIHPSQLHYDNTLSNGVKYYFNLIGLKRKIRIVNRLDKDTSRFSCFC